MRSSTCDAADVASRLSDLLGRTVTLWPLQSAENREHYRRGLPDKPDMIEELRDIFGRLPDEPLPDLSVFSPELFEFTSPLGTYFDAFPIHVLTTASLAALGADAPPERFDRRRFRPNVLVETRGRRARPRGGRRGAGSRCASGEAVVQVQLPHRTVQHDDAGAARTCRRIRSSCAPSCVTPIRTSASTRRWRRPATSGVGDPVELV